MNRRRGIRQPNRNEPLFARCRASTYIRPIEAIQPGDKVWLWCRVSKGQQNASGNNKDQEAALRADVKKQGGIVVGLALLVKQDPRFSEISLPLLNLILGTTVLHEFVGPLFTEVALKKTKEITVK